MYDYDNETRLLLLIKDSNVPFRGRLPERRDE